MGERPVVFVSYSRDDAEWRRRFTEMLKPLVRERRQALAERRCLLVVDDVWSAAAALAFKVAGPAATPATLGV